MTGVDQAATEAAGASARWRCGVCKDWTTVGEARRVGDGATLTRAVPCPNCQPLARVPQKALDRATGRVGIVMWSWTALGTEGLVIKYALRPEAGGVEWMAEDVELLNDPAVVVAGPAEETDLA